MQAGEKYKIHIDSYSHEGSGIGRIDGFVVMTPGALRGEDCEITITRLHKSYAEASLNYTLNPSESRCVPDCKYFSNSSDNSCGGCDLQHMTTLEEDYFKETVLKNALTRISGLSWKNSQIDPISSMDYPFEYRNIAQYHSDGDGKFGFYAKNSNEIIDIDYCHLQNTFTNNIYKSIKNFCLKNEIDFIKHLIIRTSRSGETMVILIIRQADTAEQRHCKVDPANQRHCEHVAAITNQPSVPQSLHLLISHITNNHSECVSIYQGYENTNPNKIKYTLLHGKKYITERIGNLNFNISCRSFFQINPVQTEILYNKILELSGLTGREQIYDLYCGTGTISLYLAPRSAAITGVELAASAVADARRNAELNNIRNAAFIEGKSENIILGHIGINSPDLIILDPPRAGCAQELLTSLLKIKPVRIIYVSCNPATLARDLKVLCSENGYKIKSVHPVNMFPRTHHVETITLLQRRDM